MNSLLAKLITVQLVSALIAAAILWRLSDQTLMQYMSNGFISHGQTVAESAASAIETHLVNRDLTSVQSALDACLKIPDVEWIYVTSADGKVVADTFVPSFPDALPKSGHGKSWFHAEMPVSGKLITVFNQPVLTGIVGEVHVAFKRQNLVASMREVKIIGLLSVGGVMLLMTVVLALVTRHFIAPVGALTRAASAMASDTNAEFKPLKVVSNDEIGILTVEFNRMVSESQEHRRNLEERVQERTRELTGLVRELEDATARDKAAAAAEREFVAEIQRLNDRLKRENTRMSSELEVTQQLQQMMLPREEELRRITQMDISGFMRPADEVGGDYYDVVPESKGVVFGIGDVTGHGLQSGVIAIMVQTAVRTLLASGQRENGRFFEILNRVVCENVRRMRTDRNVTFSLLHYQDGEVTISGQHEEVLVVRGDGTLERHDTLNLGFPLGLESDISAFIAESKFPLGTGDVMAVYTDGITEAVNPSGVSFGIDRLALALRDSHHLPAEEIRNVVLANLNDHLGSSALLDDISLLVVKPV